MAYADIRTALEDFSVDSLHRVARLGHALLRSDSPIQHPSAVYAVAITAQKIAMCWDGVAVAVESACLVDAQLRPKMLAVLDAAERNEPDALIEALDNLARAYSDATPFLNTPYR